MQPWAFLSIICNMHTYTQTCCTHTHTHTLHTHTYTHTQTHTHANTHTHRVEECCNCKSSPKKDTERWLVNRIPHTCIWTFIFTLRGSLNCEDWWTVLQAWNLHHLELSPGTWSLWLSQASVHLLWSLCWCHGCSFWSTCSYSLALMSIL